jgi:hypothetical protein
MLTRPNLVNILAFMERASCQGKEALGWVETYQAVAAEIRALDSVVPSTPPVAP